MKTQYLEYAERDVYMDHLKESPDNNSCFDCAKKAPKWSSTSFGILLCLDCSGKHRELGPQISFVRSLTLDDWTLKQIMHLELGGNKACAENFKRYGLSKPFDYRSANAQKYKQELAKKVDTYMAAQSGATTGTTTTANVVVNKPEEKPNTFFEAPANDSKLTKSTSEPEKIEPVPTIDKNSTKAKNFSVEFSSKGGNTGKKGIQAKKITNFDLEGLSMEESGTGTEKKETGMTEFSLGASTKENDTTTTTTSTTNSNGWEPKSTSYSGYGSNSNQENGSNEDVQEKLQKFGNAKSISSDAFYGKKDDEPAFNTSKFTSSRAISSNQVFGREEEEAQNSNATVEKLKAGASYLGEKAFDWGGKLKEKAGGWMSKFKTSEWAT
jgi:ADP-ribosylation factor GTPase-activating protein 2/3